MAFYRNQIVFGQLFFYLLAKSRPDLSIQVKTLEKKFSQINKILKKNLLGYRSQEISFIFSKLPEKGYRNFEILLTFMANMGIINLIGENKDTITLNPDWDDPITVNDPQYEDFKCAINLIISDVLSSL